MELIVKTVDVWAADIQDAPGALANKLTQLADAGADLDFIISRRKPEGEARTSLVQLPGFINRTLIWLVDLENLLTRHLRLPWGASVVAVARKPDA